MMRKQKTIADVLRQAIVDSKIPYLTLQQATGVERASITRFVRGLRTLRLDMADRLAAHLGVELRWTRRRKG